MPLEFDKGIAVVLHAQIPTESPPPPPPSNSRDEMFKIL